MRPLVPVVLGVGARSALGLNALQVATAMRAFQLEPRACPYPDRTGERAGLAWAECLSPEHVGFERFVAIAAPALREAAHGLERATLLVALPEAERPDQRADPRFETALLEALASACGLELARGSAILRRGHAGFGHGLERAVDLLDGLEAEDVVCGGVDSPFHPEVVPWLDDKGRLCREDDADGRIPGEAAAFVRLGRRPLGSKQALGRPVAVECATAGIEPSGRVLGKLLRSAAHRAREGRVSWLLPDLNGELRRNEEWGEAVMLASDVLEDAFRDDPVPHTSDTGAATGALLSVIALVLARIGAVDAHEVVASTSSDEGEHAVMLWELPPSGGSFAASTAGVRTHRVSVARSALPPSAAEHRQQARAVRSCLEDLGSMGLLLAPEPVEEGDASSFGRRLLGAFDALSAIGFGLPGATYEPALAELVDAYERELPGPDRARQFAVGFTRSNLVPRSTPKKRVR